MFKAIADGILHLTPALALALVFLLPLLEASAFVGFVIPGEIGVLLGGVLANQHKLALAAVLVAGITGAIIGDSIGYEVGRRYGRTLLAKLPKRLVKPEHLDKAEETVRRLGGRAVFVGRFTTALRVLIPGFAGMSRIPYGKFLLFNALGGLIWAAGFILLGYAVGSQYPTVEKHASQVGWGILALVVVAIVVVRVRNRRAERTAR